MYSEWQFQGTDQSLEMHGLQPLKKASVRLTNRCTKERNSFLHLPFPLLSKFLQSQQNLLCKIKRFELIDSCSQFCNISKVSGLLAFHGIDQHLVQ